MSAAIITVLTCIVVPTNMFTHWQISRGNLKLAYPLLMFVYLMYIVIETLLALRDLSQVSVLLFNIMNCWGFYMALKGFYRLKEQNL